MSTFADILTQRVKLLELADKLYCK